jgi:hypothetical protein
MFGLSKLSELKIFSKLKIFRALENSTDSAVTTACFQQRLAGFGSGPNSMAAPRSIVLMGISPIRYYPSIYYL